MAFVQSRYRAAISWSPYDPTATVGIRYVARWSYGVRLAINFTADFERRLMISLAKRAAREDHERMMREGFS